MTRTTEGHEGQEKKREGEKEKKRRESIEKQNDKSQCARGLPRFRAQNSTMPENKEPPVSGASRHSSWRLSIFEGSE